MPSIHGSLQSVHYSLPRIFFYKRDLKFTISNIINASVAPNSIYKLFVLLHASHLDRQTTPTHWKAAFGHPWFMHKHAQKPEGLCTFTTWLVPAPRYFNPGSWLAISLRMARKVEPVSSPCVALRERLALRSPPPKMKCKWCCVAYVVWIGLESLVSIFTSKRKLKFKGCPFNGARYLEGDSRRDTSDLLTLCMTTRAYRMVKILDFRV